jgi:hypothetical protein
VIGKFLVETGENSMMEYRTKLFDKYIIENNVMITFGDALADVNINEFIRID